MEPFAEELLWIVIVGFIISFILAFAIGANDVANSVSTSVGSGVLTLRQAYILATFCEILGAILVGNKVSDTMRKVLLDVKMYENAEKELMLGCLAAQCSSAVWLLLATYFKLPISCSHSIVGAMIGFCLVGRGTKGLNWIVLVNIVVSWFASPLISGLTSLLLFVAVYNFIVLAKHPRRAALRSLPIFCGLTFFINVLGSMLDGPKLLYMDLVPLWAVFVLSLAAGFLAALIAQLYFVPLKNRRISQHMEEKAAVASETTAVTTDAAESEEVSILFQLLQILSTGFACFAHGGNDVCNAIGPLVAICAIYSDGSVMQKGETPIYLLAYGGFGIVLGLWIWGNRVIQTIGTDLAVITATSGFTIESGSAVTVLTASKLGLPISTTHCKVGAVVFVGHMTGIYEKRREDANNIATQSIVTSSKTLEIDYIEAPKKRRVGVNWALFRNIVYAWIVTVPVTMGLSALFMFIMSKTLL